MVAGQIVNFRHRPLTRRTGSCHGYFGGNMAPQKWSMVSRTEIWKIRHCWLFKALILHHHFRQSRLALQNGSVPCSLITVRVLFPIFTSIPVYSFRFNRRLSNSRFGSALDSQLRLIYRVPLLVRSNRESDRSCLGLNQQRREH